MHSGRQPAAAGSSEAAGLAAVRRRANSTDGASASPCPIDDLTDGLVKQVLSLLRGEDLHNARLACRRFDAASRAGAAVRIDVAAAAESGPPNWARFPEMTDLTLVGCECVEPGALRSVLSNGGGGDDDAAAAAAASAARLAAVERLAIRNIANGPIMQTLECALSRIPRVASLALDCSDGGLDAPLARSLALRALHVSSVDLHFGIVQSDALPFLRPLKCTALSALPEFGPPVIDGALLASWKDTLQRFDMDGTAVQEVPCVMPHLTGLASLDLRPDVNTLNTLAANLPSLQAVHLVARGNWAGMQRQHFAPLASVKRAEVVIDKESCGVPLARLIPNVEALYYASWGAAGDVRLPSLAGLAALRSLTVYNMPLTEDDAEAIVAAAPQLTALKCVIIRPHSPAIGALSGLRGLGTLIMEVWNKRGSQLPARVTDALLAVTALTTLTCLSLWFLESLVVIKEAEEEEEEAKSPSMWEAVCHLLVARVPLRLLQINANLEPEDIRALGTLPTLRTLWWWDDCGGRLTHTPLRSEDSGATPEGPVCLEHVIPRDCTLR